MKKSIRKLCNEGIKGSIVSYVTKLGGNALNMTKEERVIFLAKLIFVGQAKLIPSEDEIKILKKYQEIKANGGIK